MAAQIGFHQLRSGVRSLALGLVLLAAATAAGAQNQPNGDQFQVNQYTTGAQREPAAATDGRGIVVVTWSTPGAGTGDEIAARRYARHGAALGAQFVVNNLTTAVEYVSRVAADDSGRFVVVWDSLGSAGNDTSFTSIQARRFTATGTPAAAQFQVNTVTTDYQREPDVAAAGNGRFVVVWTSEVSTGSDAEGTSIQGRLYDAAGTPLTAQFQVNSHTPNDQSKPSVAMDPAGNFVVAWESYSSPGTDGDFRSVQARRYDSAGTAQGAQFQVNTYTTGVQTEPDVTLDGSGRFFVAWTSNEATGDPDLESIQAQRYAANGSPLGGQFQVNLHTTSAQANPSIASGDDGAFVVTWGSDDRMNGDTDATAVRARRFAANGAATTGDFLVNTYTTSYQDYPSVTADADGNFMVVWNSFGSNGTDNEGWGIHARRYDSLFRDGVETGTTGRWSSAVP